MKIPHQPVLIGIGGSHSKIGKTTVAEELLKHFGSSKKERNLQTSELANFCTSCGWGAIKYTKTPIYASIIDDKDILAEEGKDTARMLNAGAEKVLWVQSPREDLAEVLPMAVSRLSNLKGIVIEGNSAIEFLKPDIVIFISGRASSVKESAIRIIAMADIILFREDPPAEMPLKAKKFNMGTAPGLRLGRCLKHLDKLLNE